MFSFIKWIGSLRDRLKKNKGLWFTSLTVISLIGIFSSLYFVNFLVNDVAKKTYENQKSHYLLELKGKIREESLYVESIASVISKDENIANLYFLKDENSSKKIEQKIKTIQSLLNSKYNKEVISISLKECKNGKKINGIEVSTNGAVIKSSLPMLKDKDKIISIVVKKDISYLADSYKQEQKDFLFILSENSINRVDRDIKKRDYKNIDDKFFINTKAYDGNLISAIASRSFTKELKDEGYIKGSKYFYVYQKLYDIDGDLAGYVVVAEEIKDDNSFVNLVKNLVNSVTMVALGLIVSMILFLF